MRLELRRDRSEPSILTRGTPGDLFIDGLRYCATLEDVERPRGEKVPGETAIPTGTYQVVLEMSARFQRELPEIKGVPGFSEVKFHRGNTVRDTAGCPLVGMSRVGLVLAASKLAEEGLVERLRRAGGRAELLVQ